MPFVTSGNSKNTGWPEPFGQASRFRDALDALFAKRLSAWDRFPKGRLRHPTVVPL